MTKQVDRIPKGSLNVRIAVDDCSCWLVGWLVIVVGLLDVSTTLCHVERTIKALVYFSGNVN